MLTRLPLLSSAVLFLAPMIAMSTARAQEEGQAETPPTPEAEPAAVAPAEPEPEEPAATAPKAAGQTENMVVTGSRIRRKDLTTPAPVTVINRQQIIQSGKVSIGEFLQSLPEQGNALNTSVNNGGDGSTRVDLRSLGANRTLVLLNGRRFVPGGIGADDTVDLNSIPTAVVERIEILKDGASAVYGSDAIGGVVNLITRKDYSGTDASAYSGMSQHGDGFTYDLNATTGTTSERSSILFSAGYYRAYPIWGGDRKWADPDLYYDFPSRQISTTGVTGVPGTMIYDYEQTPGNQTWTDLTSVDGDAGYYTRDLKTGRWRPFNFNGIYPGSGDLYNYQPDNYLVTPQQRISLFAIGDLKLGDHARAYFEASYVNRHSQQMLAPAPLYTSDSSVTVSKDNIYNPFGRDFGDVERRMVEFGNRYQTQDIDTFRIVTGVDGSLPSMFGPLEGWNWDLALNYGRTQGTWMNEGDLRKNRLAQAVGPSFIDADGVARCGTPGATIEDCVPLDLFHGPGSITPEMVKYLSFAGTERGYTQQVSALFNVGGELFTLYADRPWALAAGYEHRRASGADIADPVTAGGDNATGNAQEPTQGQYYVNEAYLELSMPILSNMTGIEDLEATAAARFSDYNMFGSTLNYKLGARWRVIPDVTVRSTFSTAERAPAINELYLGNVDSWEFVTDPCSDRVPGSNVDKLCKAQGVPENLHDVKTQLKAIWRGNSKLKPETAKIYTIGAVFEPRWVNNFAVTVDYYHIKITNAIARVGAANILATCYPTSDRITPAYCSSANGGPGINRDSRGLISSIDDPMTNVGGEETAGVDIGANYRLGSPVGRWGFTVDATWLRYFDRTVAGYMLDKNGNKVANVFHGKGTYDLGVYPDWKARGGVVWAKDEYGAGLVANFVDGFREYENRDSRQAYQAPAPLSRPVDAYATFDGFVNYNLDSSYGKTGVTFGVNNILNTDPRFLYTADNNHADGQTYDFIGRYFYLRLDHSF